MAVLAYHLMKRLSEHLGNYILSTTEYTQYSNLATYSMYIDHFLVASLNSPTNFDILTENLP